MVSCDFGLFRTLFLSPERMSEGLKKGTVADQCARLTAREKCKRNRPAGVEICQLCAGKKPTLTLVYFFVVRNPLCLLFGRRWRNRGVFELAAGFLFG